MKLRKLLLLTLVLTSLFVVGHVALAQLGVEYGAATGLGQQDIRITIANIIRVVLGLVGIIILALMVYAGFLWTTSAGDSTKIDRAKHILINATIGLAITLSAFAITQFVISQLREATGLTDGSGGTGGGPGGGGLGGGAYVLRGISPVGPVAIRNVVVRAIFSGNLDSSSVAGNFEVRRASDNTPVAGTINVIGSELDFTPSADCPAPNSQIKCFDENTAYNVEVKSGIKSASGQAIVCGGFAPDCIETFTTGSEIDVTASTVNLIWPNQSFPYIYASSLNQLQANALDDSGISYVKFLRGDVLIDTLVPPTSVKNYDAILNWDGAGLQTGSKVMLNVAAGDLDSHETLGQSLEVTVLAAHCNNAIKDADESGVDCGGSDCLICSGSACQNNTQCATGSCVNGQCVDEPLIMTASPLDGAVGNLVTISGKYFGANPGSVVFLGGSGSGDDKVASLASCGAPWSNTQIIVAVPAGAVTGPVQVVAANTLTDETNDVRGPNIGDFVVNSITRPGICGISPVNGSSGDKVTILGTQFGAGQGSSEVRFETRLAGVVSGKWNNTNIATIVPKLTEGSYRVTVIRNNEISNPVLFSVLPQSATQPDISYIDPLNGPVGEYVTVFGQRFGTTPGTIILKNPNTLDEAIGDVDFPPQCGASFWHDDYIIIKVPSQYKTGLVISKNVPLEVYVVRADGTKSIPATFTVNNNQLKPGICKLAPDNGPIGTTVNIFGENFNDAPGTITFFDDLDAPIAYWNPNGEEAAARVPTGAKTGAVSVKTKTNAQSNSANFEVADCRQVGCGTGEQCCGSSCIPGGETCISVKKSGFMWRVSTGPLSIIPHIIEEQSCSLATQTPSPWKNSLNACINAQISFRFNTLMDRASFNIGSVKVEPCGTGINGNFSDALCGGQLTGFSNFIFTDTPAGTGVTVNGGSLSSNLFYRVTIDQSVQSSANVPMSVPYVWHFKTASTAVPCALSDVLVSPLAITLTNKYVTGLEPNSVGNYVATPEAVNCNVLSCDAYQWNWSLSGPPNTALLSNTTCQAMVGALTETGATPIDVNVEAKTLAGLDPHSDTAKLTIKFRDPEVSRYWPTCDAACVNAQIGAEFTGAMDDNTLNNSNVKVFECPDAQCATTASEVAASIIYEAATNIVRIYPSVLKPDTYYRARLSKNIKSSDGAALVGLNEGGLNFSWIFKTKNDVSLCGINSVSLSPSSATAHIIGESTQFTSVPKGSPDSCDPTGQELNPLSYPWTWNSADTSVGNFQHWNGLDWSPYNSSAGDLFNFMPPVTALGCSSQCKFVGALNSSECGNGSFDLGEQCDDNNVINGDGCSNKCLLEGSTGVALCGNTIIEKGEACDDGNKNSGDGCSSQCLNEGSSIYYYNVYNSALSGDFGSYCGNGVIERGEDCDAGLDSAKDQGIDPLQVVRAVSGVGTKNQSKIETSSNGITGTADYTVQCGARIDFDCNGGVGAGAGTGSCCFVRPSVISVEPQGANACRNAAIIARFNQVMAEVSFGNNVYLLKEKGAATTCSDQQIFNNVTYCSGPQATFEFRNFDDNGDKKNDHTDLVVRQSDALDPNSSYAILIKGDGDVGDKGKGVLSANQVGLATPQYVWTFKTGADICKIQAVEVTPGSRYFRSVAETQQFVSSAMTRNTQNNQLTELSPISSYSWTNTWTVSDPTLLQIAGANSGVSAVIAPQNKNGNSTVSVMLDITDNTGPQTVTASQSGAAKVVNFLCLNPVFIPDERDPDPNKHLYLGFKKNYNFSFAYCRDNNTPESAQDDLPGVELSKTKPLGLFTDSAVQLAYNKISLANTVKIALEVQMAAFDPATIVEEKILVPTCSDIEEPYGAACKNHDAFGVRVIDNPNNLNPLDWYKANGFEGTPTLTTVNGYEAIVDGRTVYVVAANVTKTSANQPITYKNVYVLSYSQNASPEAIRIFNQLLGNWQINTNLTETRLCQNTAVACSSDLDCKVSVDACVANKCQKTGMTCNTPADCVLNTTCDADLLKVRRNIKRITDLVHTSNTVLAYKAQNGVVPTLKQGSFVRAATVSSWPSWKATLSGELKDTLPTDPLNKFSACGLLENNSGTNQETCWNDAQKNFSCSPDSEVYLYESSDANNYTLYGRLEPTKVSMGQSPSIPNVSFTLENKLCIATIISSQTPKCGNGTVEFGEQCDGNPPTQCNNNSQQVCNSSCKWVNQSCTRSPSCGNGVVEPLNGETCDDGSKNGSYGYCKTNCTGVGLFCGDSTKQPEEFCDIGGSNDAYYTGLKVCANDINKFCGLDSDCAGARCVPQATSCNMFCDGYGPYCGDRVVSGAEVCDSSVAIGDRLCESTSANKSGSSYKICSSDASCPSGEKCLNSASATYGVKTRWSASCNGVCRWKAAVPTEIGQCGNGATEPGEECDDGNQIETDNCTATCKLARCGDAKVESGREQCDQGANNGNAPVNVPYGKVQNYCGATCKIVTVSGGSCGDGKISGSEQCDSSVLTGVNFCIPGIGVFASIGPVCTSNPTGQVFGGKTCSDYEWQNGQNFGGGDLSCTANCSVDTSQCLAPQFATTKIQGSLDWTDGANCSIGGWAIDFTTINPVNVNVYKDDPTVLTNKIGTYLADQDRPDLETQLGTTDTKHGFVASLPAGMKDNTAHNIFVFGVESDGKETQLDNVPKSITCTPPQSAPTINFTATPASVVSGSAATLDWSSTNATTCTASGAWSGSKALSGSQSTGAITSNQTYTLSCTGAGGTTTKSVTVSVTTLTPTVTFTASPASVTSGGSSNLTWSSTNATTCTASGAWSGTKALSGSQSTGAITSNQTYTLSCTGAGGTTTRSVTVTITAACGGFNQACCATAPQCSTIDMNCTSGLCKSCGASGDPCCTNPSFTASNPSGCLSPLSCSSGTCTSGAAPTVNFSASPATLLSGASSNLTWSSTNATTCTASGAWSGAKASSGSQSTGALTSTKTYTLACTGTGGTTTKSVTVTVSTIDSISPTVTITSPTTGATLVGSVTVAANASDNVGVVGVQFKANGVNIGAEDTTAPYAITWDTTQVTNSSYVLTAVARDAAANTGTSPGVQVTTSNVVADNATYNAQATPPSVLTPGQTGNGSVTMINSGSNTWTVAGGYFLTSANPWNTNIWGVRQVGIDDTKFAYTPVEQDEYTIAIVMFSVASGASKKFDFTWTAPSTPGTYNWQWRMARGASGFGAFSPNTPITVCGPQGTTCGGLGPVITCCGGLSCKAKLGGGSSCQP